MSGAAAASMDSKASDKKATKFFLPRPAVDLREALYANGRQPSDSEKWTAYELIVKMEGCESYARKTHSNYCTHIERKRKAGLKGRFLIFDITALTRNPQTRLPTPDR
ncbi:hypothetical protein DICSQDRAFT_140624 [Dichomitus squalens LYAD-421 SS1]|uniref:Uncharacterized protein n=1 Tax=Dichomitus squalens (strain LYAD-421) TaxID=732165 RepID=R7SQF9_DICSQ|nr:uncharacterized protein DICSQDRAFT_140624 [Dichomitus squalens LYAD-421 SS1]EJF57177.1 hypothetical protein DICSQDRAFT_140624 [Dichomitus squalens LYAD-421 SS1]